MPRRASPPDSQQQPDLFGGDAPGALAAPMAAAPAAPVPQQPAPQSRLPDGMRYEPDFLGPDEEAELLRRIEALPLAPMRYQGYTALRRVVSFGGSYDFSARRLNEAEPIPGWLAALRTKAGAWAGLAPEDFVQVLVAEYRPGTPLGWHRDVPDFEDVVGVSLLADATLRLRPYPPREPKKADVLKFTVAPRSVYLLRGAARWAWQHSVAPTRALRYSVTLRTARRAA